LHGIGVTAVNALSASLQAKRSREGKTEVLEFQEGKLVGSSQIIDTPQQPSGTNVTFTPDPKIFQEFTYFKIETIQNRLNELAYLNPNLTLIFYTSPEATPIVYHFDSGLAG
jgi:DNA gyrase subunit B